MGTLGRALVDGADEVKLFDERIRVAAQILQLPGISGHADQDGLVRWLRSFEEKPSHVFVNHGDDTSCIAFRDLLSLKYGYEATAPYSGAVYDLAEGRYLAEPAGVRILREETESQNKKAGAEKEAQVEATQAKKSVKKSSDTKSSTTYNRLLAAIERLGEVAQKNRNRSDKDLKKFLNQVENLCKQWRR